MRPLATSLAVALVLLTAIPAQAHDDEETDDWHAQWAARVEASEYLTIDLMLERADFQRRHPQRRTVFLGAPYRGMGAGVVRWLPLVEQHFEHWQVETMMCLMGYESGGNPDAKNPTSSARGLFQILSSLWGPIFGVTPEQLFDPVINTSVARRVYERHLASSGNGFTAWSPYNRGLCHGL